MAALEAAITKILIDVAVKAGVDVLSKRAANPTIRGAGRSYKVFALVSIAGEAYQAVRICAYSDAARLIGQEALVELSSKRLAEALLRLSEANYDIHQHAQDYLLTPEYAEADIPSQPLGRWLYTNQDFMADNLTGFGRPLADQTGTCVARAVRASEIATELSAYPEARAARRFYRERKENWADRVNTELGHLLWRPVPKIGLGRSSVSNGSTYCGIFRRNTPEGYGSITWPNGRRYYGQSRFGFMRGYGVLHLPDGSIYAGKYPSGDHELGATISPRRDWVYYGEHKGTRPDGYGRRVGLVHGLESVSGWWREGKLERAYETLVDVYRRIADGMEEPVVRELRMKYEGLAGTSERAIAVSDEAVLSLLRPHL